MRKDRTPSESAFENFLLYLDPQRTRAAQKYVQLHEKLVFWLEHHRCSKAQELADRTLDTVARQLLKGLEIQADDPMDYCLGVARNLLKRERALDLKQVPLDDLPLQSEKHYAHEALRIAMDNDSHQQRADCLRHCLRRLSSEDRRMLELYYHDDWHQQVRQRKQLVRQLAWSEENLRSHVHRLRARLKTCMKSCLEDAA
ncbi:MAG: sigma-70 family RNA polymerase sigma factor [Acidobacteria bacterium]|nr:sigma-70 family RNA polymerase sigma factor [Acidobacteriota bacterium]